MAELPDPGPRQQRAADARHRLLAAAIHEFAARPYDQVAIDDITGRAATAHGSLFHHFESKRGIYLAAMEAIAARFRERRAQIAEATPVERIRRELEEHLSGIAAHPDLFVSLMRGGIGADPEARQIFERDRWRSIEILAGELGLPGRNDAVRIALRAWIGAVDEAAIAWLENGRPFPLPHMVEAFLGALPAMVASIGVFDPSLDVAAACDVCRSPAAPQKAARARLPARRKRAR